MNIKRVYFLIFYLVFTHLTASLMANSCLVNTSAGEICNFSHVIMLNLILIYFSCSKRIFYFIGIPFNLGFALYSWVGLSFGLPNYGYIVSIFNTNSNEIKSFLKLIPLINYTYPFTIMGLTFIYYYVGVKYNIDLVKYKIFNVLVIIFIFICFLPINVFYNNLYKSVKLTYQTLKITNESKNLKPDWKDVKIDKNKYKNYVLIIGESQRRDYFNAYGYPIKNTPFLSNSKGVLVEGLTAGGLNTIASLEKMLTNSKSFKEGGKLQYNFIDLANKAGLETYWISNQGHYGSWDTSISIIADRSKNIYFYNESLEEEVIPKNIDDFLLVENLKEILKNNKNQNKLIVIHLIGSHYDSCDFIEGLKEKFSISNLKYKNIECYVNSIKKTDSVLNEIFNSLEKNYQQTKDGFSMLYFADHGERHILLDDGNVILHHPNDNTANQFAIPLFKVSSDDTKRTVCKSFKSGLNFTNGLANWMGIKAKGLDPNYSLFDCKNDPDDYGLKNIINNQETIKDGNAIDLTPYLIK